MLDTETQTSTTCTAELPRLSPSAPLLRRGPGELQLGAGGDGGLVLSGVPDGTEQVLRLADGRHTRVDLLVRAIAYEIEPALIDGILQTLTAAGLIVDDAARPEQPVPLQLRLVGAGRLGSAVATTAVRAGVGRLFVADNDTVDPELYPHAGLATSQAAALVAELSGQLPPGQIQVVDHWSKPEQAAPDLTVIATDYAEPDPAIGRDFVDSSHPHLYLRPFRGGAVIGPFVRPGISPCLRCIDLTRRDADPAWPTMLPQLCRTTMPVTPLLASWAAVTAFTQIVAAYSGRRPSTLAGTLELALQQSEPRFRRWPLHPQCDCAELI